MKTKTFRIFYLTAFVFLFFVSCDNQLSNEMTTNPKKDYEINYKLRQVLQYDPMNINGINIVNKLDFFPSLKLTLYYKDGKLTNLSYDNGEVPFSPFNFEAEQKFEAECELDYEALPNELRIKGTNKVVAYFRNGEFSMPFKLDCELLDYKYTFTND